jgi:leucyl/phenylalanyl-tRNA--protein transferase
MLARFHTDRYPFPDPRTAGPEGLVAYGGDLNPERLLAAYAQGIFPWPFDARTPLLWFSPDPRMVLRPSELHVSRSLKRILNKGRFTVTFDTAFSEVIQACAATRRRNQRGTWITPDLIQAYVTLHEMGYAHSVEAWHAGQLVGGLYGVSLGAAFFGESMFTRQSNASKVAFVHLVRQLELWHFHFVDCQIYTPHLASFGATPWPRTQFLSALAKALEQPTRQGSWKER